MKLSLGCIADDYTGASDLANTLTRQGLRTVQTIGVPSDDLALPEVDAVVVSLKSRSIEADVAVDAFARRRKMAARPRRRPRAVQDLLDLRFHRCRQYRPRHGRAARRFRRRDRAGDAGLSGNRPHRLSGQSVRRQRAAERKPAEGSSAQPDARFQSGAGAGAPEPDQGRAGRSRHAFARRGCGSRTSRRSRREGHRRRDHRRRVRPRSRNHRQRRAGSSPVGRRVRHRPRSCPGAGRFRQGQIGCGRRGVRRAGRRTGGVPGRELFAGDAGADRQRRKDHGRAASRSRTDHRRARRGAPRAGLGERPNRRWTRS